VLFCLLTASLALHLPQVSEPKLVRLLVLLSSYLLLQTRAQLLFRPFRPLLRTALKAAFPANPLLTCVTWIGAAQPTPGLVINNNLPSPCMQFGPFYAEGASDAGEMESANKLNALFSKVEGVKGEVVIDIQTERWKKVIWLVSSRETLLVAILC